MLLLHISDIHFKAPQCLNPDMDPDRGVRTRLERHLATQIARLGKVDAILVGGDVAFKGDPSEYGVAKAWLLKLAKDTGCHIERILVIPGNHDVDRDAISKAMNTRNAQRAIADEKQWRESVFSAQLSDASTGEALFHGHRAYNEFAAPMHCQVWPGRIYWKQDLDLSPTVKLRIHGLTSTILSGRDGKDDQRASLYVSPLQTALDPVPNVVNLVMCHHPFDWLIDGDQVEDALNGRATFQIFGHKHRQRLLQETNFVRWAAGAVNPSRSENQYEPGYNLVKINVLGVGKDRCLSVETHQFTYQSNPEGFRPIKTSGDEDVFRHSIAFPEDTVPVFDDPAVTTGHAVVSPVATISSATDAEAAMGSEVTRNIVSRFWDLASSDRRRIALELGLISDEEVTLPEPERYGKALIRAKERDLLERLAAMVAEREG